MQPRPNFASAIAFVVALLAIGIPYWQIPYSRVSLPSSLYGLGLVALLAVAALLRFGSRASFVRAWLATGAAVPAVILARVAFDTARDPTSHNLWALEVIIAAAIGLAVSCAGALLGSGLLVLLRPRR